MASQRLFSFFASAAAYSLASPAAPIALDVSQLAQAFEGIVALSGGGGVTRLLIDYSEALQQDIYDILFTPKAGASLQISTLQAPSGSPSLRSSRSLPTTLTALGATSGPSFVRRGSETAR
jgi:hypothetical protein